MPSTETMLTALVTSAFLLSGYAPGQVATPLDTMLDVGGHRLHFRIHQGSLPVTVVMEAGGGATLARWGTLDEELARRTRATVVAYERAGFGRSELGPPDLTPSTEVTHLAAALERLGVPSRRILLGTSYGGLMAVLHADAYPDRVAGVVLADPMSSRFVDATGDFVYSTVPQITDPKTDRERAIARMVRTFGDLVNLARRAEPSVRAPMVVITSSKSMWNNREREDRAWRATHEAIASAAPGRRLVVAENSGHQIALDRPDTIVDAVLSLLGVRHH